MNSDFIDQLIIDQIRKTSFNHWEADQAVQAFMDRDPDGDTWLSRAEAIARSALTVEQKMQCIQRMRDLQLFSRFPEFKGEQCVTDGDLGDYLIIESEAVFAGTGAFDAINVQGVKRAISPRVKSILLRIPKEGVGLAAAIRDFVRSLCAPGGKYHDEWNSRDERIDPADTIESLVISLYSRVRKGAVGCVSVATTLDPEHGIEVKFDEELNILA